MIGAVVFGVAAAFCVRTIVDQWPRVRESATGADPRLLFLALLFAAAAMVGVALGWRRSLVVAGGPLLERSRVVPWYFMGELGKYVPGSVWSIVGRAELARRAQVPRRVAYASVVLSLAAWYGAAVLPLGLVALHPRVLGRLTAVATRITGKPLDLPVPPFAAVARLLACYLPVWVLIGGCTVATASALDAGGSPPRLAAATVIAWVAGFAAVPVPAGAGVREVVFVALAGVPSGVAVAIAVLARMCFMTVDASGAALAFALRRRQREGRKPPL